MTVVVAEDLGGEGALRVADALGGWADFLVGVKGCSAGTAATYGRHAGPFLTAVLAGSDGVAGLRVVRPEQVRSYVTDLGERYATHTCKLAATSIRSFLGFAWLSGWTTSDLRGAVGPIITHPYGHLPKAISARDVERLLASPDRGTGSGVRDYAMLLLLVRLGLRAGEVASLRLDDIDWAAATITATVKGGARRTYPLPQDVGVALVPYLRQRPAGVSCREVFLQVRTDRGPMTGSSVTLVVARNAARAGLGTVRAHRLRHSAARAILDGGGTLAEVGELLGHNSGKVTPLYASLDLASLRSLVRTWPGVAADA